MQVRMRGDHDVIGQRSVRRRGRLVLLLTAVMALVAGSCVEASPRAPLVAGPSGAGTAPEGHRRILVFSRTMGFRHDSIADGKAMLAREAPTWGIDTEFTEDPTAFTDENLARFGAVVFLSTTGDVLDEDHRRRSSGTSTPVAATSAYTPMPTPSTTGPSTADWSAPTSRATRFRSAHG